MKKETFPRYQVNREFLATLRSGSSLAYVSQSRSEEIFNMLTHGVGTALSLIGLVVLLYFSSQTGEVVRMVTTAVYALTLVFMFAASTLYHAATDPDRKKFFHTLDHSAIFILIAGANTPVMLVYLEDYYGLELFLANWVLAFTGVFSELYFGSKIPKKISISLYTMMGWLLMFAVKPMFEVMPPGFRHWLFLGGLTFMAGIYFYTRKKMYFNHVIWHIIVLCGTVFHFLGMLFYVAMRQQV